MPLRFRLAYLSVNVLVLLLALSLPRRNWAFPSSYLLTRNRLNTISLNQQIQEKDSKSSNNGKDINPVTRVSWYAAEALGSIFGRFNSPKSTNEPQRLLKYRPSVVVPTWLSKTSTVIFDLPPSTLDETLTRIQYDNDRCYFLSGNVDKLIYDPNCLFADPFVSFRGRDRFVNNLKNLNTFITQYDAKLITYNYSAIADNTPFQVNTKILVKLELNLPWKPILAWPWGVMYEIDPLSNLIMIHRESWDIDPWEGVLQVFRKPTTTIS